MFSAVTNAIRGSLNWVIEQIGVIARSIFAPLWNLLPSMDFSLNWAPGQWYYIADMIFPVTLGLVYVTSYFAIYLVVIGIRWVLAFVPGVD